MPDCWFVFSHLGFWSGNLFLIAPFPDLCLLVPLIFNVYLFNHNGNIKMIPTELVENVHQRLLKPELIIMIIIMVMMTICIYETKGANQLCSYSTSEQRL